MDDLEDLARRLRQGAQMAESHNMSRTAQALAGVADSLLEEAARQPRATSASPLAAAASSPAQKARS